MNGEPARGLWLLWPTPCLPPGTSVAVYSLSQSSETGGHHETDLPGLGWGSGASVVLGLSEHGCKVTMCEVNFYILVFSEDKMKGKKSHLVSSPVFGWGFR